MAVAMGRFPRGITLRSFNGLCYLLETLLLFPSVHMGGCMKDLWDRAFGIRMVNSSNLLRLHFEFGSLLLVF